MSKPQRLTAPRFTSQKQRGEKLSVLTAYDYPTARLLDEAGVDAILVGDSLAMVVQGHETTLPVTLEQMIYHAEMVGRAVERALVVVDLPFPTHHLGRHAAVDAAGQILKQARVQAVKLEGGVEQADTIAALTSAGIPVMAHCGLGPQSVHALGGYRVQRDRERLLADATAAAGAGAFAMVLECVPSDIAREITETIAIPTIGIGAGPHCDGQVLVTHDLLGIHTGYVPKFVKSYASIGEQITAAVREFKEEVAAGRFPSKEHEYE
jgi:3-methyl-2-oxobutanoate hydroxymethyltransferase